MACSAAKKGGGADGTCGAVLSGTDPDGECNYVSPNCAVGDACNGAGACRPAAANTPCGATTCSNGTVTGSLCNGASTCVNTPTSCGPYLCADSTKCATTCNDDNQCATSAFCRTSDQTCQPDLDDGLPCSADSQCGSGHCVDDVCCETTCTGACQACSAAKKGSGADGVCDDVAEDTDPDDDCAPDAPSTCQKNGECSGHGTCKLYVESIRCGTADCAGPNLVGHHCDGLGTCVDGETSCAPYLCAASVCPTTCGDDNACVTGNYCTNDECKPKLGDGVECSANRECSSGFCVEGVCCAEECNNPCQACAAANKESGEDGVCGLAKVGTDPHEDCVDDGALSCKRDGACDGAGACRVYEEGTACGATSCEDNVQTGFACDGDGKCKSDSVHDCGLYVCTAGACTRSCTDHDDCSEDAYCNTKSGTCKEKLDDGEDCDDPDTCSSGYCVDGLCCNKACGGQCEACDVTTAPGTCSPIVGQPHGIRPACDPGTEDDVCSARACDGERDTSSCVGYAGSDTPCRDQTCEDGVETFSATCNGEGTCDAAGPAKTKKCEPYVCQGNGCGSAPCENESDCASKFRCDPVKHDCVPKDAASCDGDHVVSNPDGTTTDCTPFKCEGTGCKDSCASVKDCVSGFVCDAAQTCVAPSRASPSPEGCGCRVGGAREYEQFWVLAIGLCAAALRRRQRRASDDEQ